MEKQMDRHARHNGENNEEQEKMTSNSMDLRMDDRDEENNNNEHDVDRIFRKLSTRPAHLQFPDLIQKQCRPVVELWHDEFATTLPKFWKRLKRNLPKELNESAFILEEMIRVCEEHDEHHTTEEPLTIIDMCSGVGYLSMLLSHLLPPEKVSRIVPIDILFRSHNDTREEEEADDGKHLSTEHFKSSIHPIEIRPRRANIKSGRELRQIAQHCIEQAPGPVIILGIHLCKALSVHTVRLFNTSPKASKLYLKPCCLPGRKELKSRHPPFWTFEAMDGGGFGIETLYCTQITKEKAASDQEKDDEIVNNDCLTDTKITSRSSSDEVSNKAQEDVNSHGGGGGNKNKTNNALFTKWVQLLCAAADTGMGDTTAEIHYRSIQEHHFQNQFIVASR